MTQKGEFIEIQGTTEENIHEQQADKMLEVAENGISELVKLHKKR